MMKEEITKVLEMVQAGTITADEGQQLLEAMGAYEEPAAATGVARKARKLYVKVDSKDGDRVNIALPLSLVKSGMALGLNFAGKQANGAMEGIDMNEVLRLVDEMSESGETGDIINVNSKDGDTVHIYLE